MNLLQGCWGKGLKRRPFPRLHPRWRMSEMSPEDELVLQPVTTEFVSRVGSLRKTDGWCRHTEFSVEGSPQPKCRKLWESNLSHVKGSIIMKLQGVAIKSVSMEGVTSARCRQICDGESLQFQ
jgi:hypothetical protein